MLHISQYVVFVKMVHAAINNYMLNVQEICMELMSVSPVSNFLQRFSLFCIGG